MKLNPLLFFGLIFVSLGCFFVWRVFTHVEIPPPLHIILYDPSDSKIKGCSCLRNHAEQLMAKAKVKSETIMLSTLGIPETGYQPRIIDTYTIPRNDSPLGNQAQVDEERKQILLALVDHCNSIPQTNTTPLFLGVQTSLEQLRMKCSLNSDCSLFVQTDLEEIVDQRVIKVFKDVKAGKNPSVELPKLENPGISVTFSGTAEIVIPSDNKNDPNGRSKHETIEKAKERLGDMEIWQKVWKPIFSNRDQVSFEPICSSPKG